MSENKYYVYILANKSNTVLYIGMTNNLARRIDQHKKKLVKGFSSKYNLNKLVYYEILNDPKETIKREKQLKNLVRRKKNMLINQFNPDWKDLYCSIL
jgi:putative endonuclease